MKSSPPLRRLAYLVAFLVSEVVRAIEGGIFHPVVGWHCEECPYRSRCWAWG